MPPSSIFTPRSSLSPPSALHWTYPLYSTKDPVAAISSMAMFQFSQGMVVQNASQYNIQGNLFSFVANGEGKIVTIAKWFTFRNFRNTQNDTYKKHTQGTGRWLLDSQGFKEWFEGFTKTFWITGMPGAGKTILSSIVNNYLQEQAQETPGVAFLFVYCRYHDQLSARDIFASWARQLTESGAPEVDVAAVHSFYETNVRYGTPPTETALLDLLDHLLSRFKKVIISIDAVDEIRDEVKESVLEALSSLNALCFITSRSLESSQTSLPNTQSLQLEQAASQINDIEFFIVTKIDTIPRIRDMIKGNDDLRAKICDRLKAKSAGMFLLCALQIESLRHVTTIKKLWEDIDSLPSGIADMYQATWKRILSQAKHEIDLARRAITLIVHAKRPLSPRELQQALAVSIDGARFDLEDVPGIDVVLNVCCGLVIADEKNEDVRLAHYTTYDFFLQLGSQLYRSPHCFIATSCIIYLSAFQFPQEFDDDQICQQRKESKHHPFLGYAYEHWAIHAHDHEALGNQLSDTLVSIVDRWTEYPLLASSCGAGHTIVGLPHVAARYGLRHYLPLILKSKHDITEEEWLPLHFAAGYGQQSVLMALLDDPSTDVNARTGVRGYGSGSTPLILATHNNQLEIVKTLLSHPDIDTNRKDREGNTALIDAAEHRRVDLVRLLLSHTKIDLNSENNYGDTAISRAGCRGEVEILQLLLSHPGIDINRGAPLIGAAKYGHRVCVEILLSCPAVDVDMRNHRGRTALTSAVCRGQIGVLKLLLSHSKIDVNARTSGKNTALTLAAALGQMEIVHLLLAHPEIEVDWGTALVDAAGGGRVESVKFLLACKDIDVNVCNEIGQTALTRAARRGEVEIVHLLLAHPEIDVNWVTPLIDAVCDGLVGFVRFLLTLEGIDVNMKDNHGDTALFHAAIRGNVDILRMLLAHPLVDVSWGTSSFDATRHGYKNPGNVALYYAARRGDVETASLLLSHTKIDVNARNEHGETVLVCVIRSTGNPDIVRLLLSHPDIDINVQNEYEETALICAARRGSLPIVKLLLSHPGIDHDSSTHVEFRRG